MGEAGEHQSLRVLNPVQVLMPLRGYLSFAHPTGAPPSFTNLHLFPVDKCFVKAFLTPVLVLPSPELLFSSSQEGWMCGGFLKPLQWACIKTTLSLCLCLSLCLSLSLSVSSSPVISDFLMVGPYEVFSAPHCQWLNDKWLFSSVSLCIDIFVPAI